MDGEGDGWQRDETHQCHDDEPARRPLQTSVFCQWQCSSSSPAPSPPSHALSLIFPPSTPADLARPAARLAASSTGFSSLVPPCRGVALVFRLPSLLLPPSSFPSFPASCARCGAVTPARSARLCPALAGATRPPPLSTPLPLTRARPPPFSFLFFVALCVVRCALCVVCVLRVVVVVLLLMPPVVV